MSITGCIWESTYQSQRLEGHY